MADSRPFEFDQIKKNQSMVLPETAHFVFIVMIYLTGTVCPVSGILKVIMEI